MPENSDEIKQSLSNLLVPKPPKEEKTNITKPEKKLGKFSKFTPKKRKEFLEILRQTGNFKFASASIGLDPSSVYRHIHKDDAFREEYKLIRDETIAQLEDEVYRRAYFGTEKPVFHKGEVVGSITEYSNDLAMFILKAARPDVYGNKTQMEVSGPDGGPVQISEAKAKLLSILNINPEDIEDVTDDSP